MALVSAFIAGLVFAVGLGISGMTQPSKVIGFLDVTGNWDPTLLFVMIGAVSVYAAVFRAIQRRQPVFAPAMQIPPPRPVDWRLLAGAAVFGVGWGLAGFCPGPAIVSLASGAGQIALFVAAMVGGMALHTKLKL
jgi:uncharacterized protein